MKHSTTSKGATAGPIPLVLIAGPTAVGKSAVALRLAELLDGEIVSVDSMQCYRGLDIGTAKPSPAERARVPHHLIDVVDLTAPFDAAQFVRLARAAVREIQARGRVPILCGGTGLYFRAFLEGLGQAPPADPALRATLAATLLPELLNELQARDPDAYAAIDRQNPRRVIRALEILRLTGQPLATQRAPWTSKGSDDNLDHPQPAPGGEASSTRPHLFAVGLARESADLRARIEARVTRMFEQGLVAETAALLAQGLARNRTAMQALGYRQVAEHLRGERALAETIAAVNIRTRQFAKRQMTWFRHQMSLSWRRLQPAEELEAVAEELASALRFGIKPDSTSRFPF